MVTSPCDGIIREVSPITKGRIVRAKASALPVGILIGDDELSRRLEGGTLVRIYLHPRDYHRVHAPCDGSVAIRRAIAGCLLPVGLEGLQLWQLTTFGRAPRIVARNARLVHVIEGRDGLVVVVMVGAFGVGRMSASYPDPAGGPVRIRRGDELGVFHLGSTVVLLGERGGLTRRSVGERVRVGDPLLGGET